MKWLLQGAVDCFFETADGSLTVVDFKTDRIAPGGEREKAEEYRPQLTAYSDVLERIFERPVTRAHSLFLCHRGTCSAVMRYSGENAEKFCWIFKIMLAFL